MVLRLPTSTTVRDASSRHARGPTCRCRLPRAFPTTAPGGTPGALSEESASRPDLRQQPVVYKVPSNIGLELTNTGAARTVLRPVRLLSAFAAQSNVGQIYTMKHLRVRQVLA